MTDPSSTDIPSDHEFGALNTLLFVIILGLCILAAYLIKVNSFYYLPESAAAILIGFIVGGFARIVYPSIEELKFLTFNSELFFFLLLPPIIFEAAYSLNKHHFFSNFWTICLYAVFGTIISTFIIGYLVYSFGLLDFVHIDTSSPMEALLFGALISSIDPVATLSIMGNAELNIDVLLYSLIFGESVLNDAVSIVLFKTFLSFYDSGKDFTRYSVLYILYDFTFVSIGSCLIGIAMGLLCCYLFKHTYLKKFPEYEISLLLLFAYGSYALAEAISMSGIMSIFFNGIILSHYNNYNLSKTSQITSYNIFKSFSILCEFFVYLFIGMGIFTDSKFSSHFNLSFSIVCLLLCLLSRAFNTFPLSWFANLWRKYGDNRQVTGRMQVVIWFAGLRGAISFALSMQIPGEHKDVYISTTLFIVVFTTIIFGGLTEPLATYMDVRSNVTHITSAHNNTSSSSSNGSNNHRVVHNNHSRSNSRRPSRSHSIDNLRRASPTRRQTSGERECVQQSDSSKESSPPQPPYANGVNIVNGHYELTKLGDHDGDRDECHSPMLSEPREGDYEDSTSVDSSPPHFHSVPLIKPPPYSPNMSYLRQFEHKYMLPLFGGSSAETDTSSLESESARSMREFLSDHNL